MRFVGGDRPAIRATGKRAVSPELSHPTPDAMTITDAFIIGRNRTYQRSDIDRIVRHMDGRGVQLLTIRCYDGSEISYCYPDVVTADDDAERIADGSVTVALRGESSRAASDRIAAVLKATGVTPADTPITHGRDRSPAAR